MNQLKIATLNLAAPSKERARRLLDEWILKSNYDIYVFSETSEGEGTDLIVSTFKAGGWLIFQRPTSPKDRGVVIASRVSAQVSSKYPPLEPISGRSIVIELDSTPRIQLIGMYVPNRGNDFAKLERKKTFLECWMSFLSQVSEDGPQRILVGDLNVVPPTQRPVFLPQQSFEDDWFKQLTSRAGLYDAAVAHNSRHEHTWIAHTGEGYTYDHILPCKSLTSRVLALIYDHTTRGGTRVTDHSALILTVSLDTITYIHQNRLTEFKQSELF